MNHKISQFCDKIDSIKKMSDRLRDMKYGPVKSSKSEIDNMIQTIQADCLLIANDKSDYGKEKDKNGDYGDYSGIDHNGMLNNKKE